MRKVTVIAVGNCMASRDIPVIRQAASAVARPDAGSARPDIDNDERTGGSGIRNRCNIYRRRIEIWPKRPKAKLRAPNRQSRNRSDRIRNHSAQSRNHSEHQDYARCCVPPRCCAARCARPMPPGCHCVPAPPGMPPPPFRAEASPVLAVPRSISKAAAENQRIRSLIAQPSLPGYSLRRHGPRRSLWIWGRCPPCQQPIQSATTRPTTIISKNSAPELAACRFLYRPRHPQLYEK